jgi:hypothetical protein
MTEALGLRQLIEFVRGLVVVKLRKLAARLRGSPALAARGRGVLLRGMAVPQARERLG